jgi:hypothetical protein
MTLQNCNRSHLDFLIYEENFVFFFISAVLYEFRLTVLLKECTECQAFFPVVRIEFPTPSPEREYIAPPPIWVQGGRHSHNLRGRVVGGGPNSDEGADTLVLYVYYSPSTVLLHPTYLVSGEGGSTVLYEFCLTAAPVLFIPLSLRLLT